MGKVKKERNSKSSQERKSDGEVSRKRKSAEKKKSSGDEGVRKYGYISAHSVLSMADSAGLSGVPEEVAKNLAEDVTYRLRYVIQQCKKYMTHSRRKKLRSTDINEVLKMCDVPAIYGFTCDKAQNNFIYIKEADVFVLNDEIVDLPSFALSEVLVERRPSVHASGVWLKSEDGSIKTEPKPKSETKPNEPNVQTNNENIKVSSKNLLHCDNQRVGNDSEENETKIPTNLIKYYGVTCNTILGHSDLKIVFNDLSNNSRIVPIVPYLLNFITIALNKLNSERQLKRLLQAVEALSQNQKIDFTPYSATTRVINAMLLIVASDKKSGKISYDFPLRLYAGHVLSLVLCQWCSRDEQRQIIVKKMGKLLSDFKAPAKVQYGAIALLTCLGPPAMSVSLWKILKQYLEYLERAKSVPNYKSGNDVAMVEEIILAGAATLYRYPADEPQLQEIDESLHSYFGDSLCNLKLSLLSHPNNFKPIKFEGPPLDTKLYSKPLKYMNSHYKPTTKKLTLDSVFSLPKPKKKKNTRIIFKFAGAIPVPEVSLKRRRFYSQYDQFIAGKESEGHVVVAGKWPRVRRSPFYSNTSFPICCLLSVL